MKILGIETSCDECAAAVVENGRDVLSNVVATQIPFHAPYSGVVPEIASRKHTEWIYAVAKEALDRARIAPSDIGAVAVASRPGLLGSLIVGLSFAKAFAWAMGIPLIAVDHMKAHLYASQLRHPAPPAPGGEDQAAAEYPFLGLLVSGGHTIICRADGFDNITVLGATIDDAVGEAFDKVAKHYGFGYPGGAVIERLARSGDSTAFRFPMPSLRKGHHRCDVSYSGLKNAAINQLSQFRAGNGAEARRCGQRPDEQGCAGLAEGRRPDKQGSAWLVGERRRGGQGCAGLVGERRRGEQGCAGLVGERRRGGQSCTGMTEGRRPDKQGNAGLAGERRRGEQGCVGLPGERRLSEQDCTDIAASFQKTAIDILLRALFNAAEDTGLSTVVAGGGVAANALLRKRLAERKGLRSVFPPLEFCGDNGAMIAGIGYQYLIRGDVSPLSANASARVEGFKKKHP